MIERLPIDINLQLGEYRNVKFDIIPKETFVMVYSKINEIIDYINRNEKVVDFEEPRQSLIDKLQAQNSALVNYLMDFMHREQEYAEKYMKGKSKATIKSYHHKIKKHLDSLGIND